MKKTIALSKGLHGQLDLPGDKSISHRALILASLAQGRSPISNLLGAADPSSTRRCLGRLGVQFHEDAATVLVHGNGLHGLRAPNVDLDCGNSGTTMRLLAGVLAGQPFVTRLFGDESLNTRPMGRIVDPLSEMGARIEASSKRTAPLLIEGKRPLKSITHQPPTPSAQVKSAVLLAGLFADGETVVREPLLTRDHTERMLGVAPTWNGGMHSVAIQGGRTILPQQYEIPGDVSSAAFFVVAAAVIPRSQILLKNVGVNPSRTHFLSILQNHGAKILEQNKRVVCGEPIADVLVTSAELRGPIHLRQQDVPLMIDEIPSVAVCALLGACEFEVRGAEELRAKESDRISSMVKNLKVLGVKVEEYTDGFAFGNKNQLIGGEIDPQGDHRIAMAFAIAGLKIPGVSILGPQCTNISFPGFWECIQKSAY
ncbi:MAG: 3-phosphoshikimate 1-carboxyvinyltransferase [Ignavibacteriales bacterium]|nr:3-phosphoshikimate 1-carboxyvinyltransferase [Ignavibacteriales bacterium]